MSFDAIAPHYRWLEWLTAGPLLQQCRTAWIQSLAEAHEILLLGEGRGRFLAELLRVHPNAHITCLDASARMLELTRSFLRQNKLAEGRVQFVHADVLTPEWNSATGSRSIGNSALPIFDGVASHFFLDCFRPGQLGQIISTASQLTSSAARWLISDFCVPDAGWQRIRARIILKSLYAMFQIATKLPARRLTPPDTYLINGGFQMEQRRLFNHGLLHSDVWVRRVRSVD